MKGTFPVDRFSTLRTPFYFYDTKLLRQTLQAISEEVASHELFEVHYAIKANANPRILKIIAESGFGADCVSGGEIEASIKAGFPREKIVYAGVGKSDWEIELALREEIACFNVESLAELEVINEAAINMGKTARVALRINPNVGAHTHANITTGLAENKFGIAMDDMMEIMERAQDMNGIHIKGIHFHIGSQILDMSDFKALCNRINDLQRQLEIRHFKIDSINVGGGLGVDYQHPNRNPLPDFHAYFETYARHLSLRPQQTVHFELGRSIVAQCGSLITKVLYVKDGTSKQFAIVDAGMTDLIRPALYQAFHKIENISSNEPWETYDVVGPVCESSDVFAKAIDINRCHRHDFLAIRSAGAYGEAMASQYNCRRLPGCVFSDDMI